MKKGLVYFFSALLFFFLGSAFNYAYVTYFPMTTETINKVTNEIKIEEVAIEEAIEKVYDSVVVVESWRGGEVIGSGTGFVYKKDDRGGYIITNYHVINNADKAVITLSNGEIVEASILGSDVYADIAVLKVDKDKIIKVASIGNSQDVKIGNTVFAIGAPIGIEYSGTVTRGIISNKERFITISLSGTTSNDWLMKVIQTDAAINPGNSGGPLVNLAGEVIGINSLKLMNVQVEGIGFAIPIDEAMLYVERLEKGELISRPILGVQLLDINETFALFYSGILVDDEVKKGVVLQAIINDSAAYKAGLQKGDIILKLGSKEVSTKAELRYELYKYSANDTVEITYYRNKKINTVKVMLMGSG